MAAGPDHRGSDRGPFPAPGTEPVRNNLLPLAHSEHFSMMMGGFESSRFARYPRPKLNEATRNRIARNSISFLRGANRFPNLFFDSCSFISETKIFLPSLIKFVGGPEIPDVIAGDVRELLRLVQGAHIVAGDARSFGTFDPEHPAPQMQAPLAAQSAVEGQLVLQIDMDGVRTVLINVAAAHQVLGGADAVHRGTDHQERHVESPSVEAYKAVIFLRTVPETAQHLFFRGLLEGYPLLRPFRMLFAGRLEIDHTFVAMVIQNADHNHLAGERREPQAAFELREGHLVLLLPGGFFAYPAGEVLLGGFIQGLEIFADGLDVENQLSV